MCGCVYIFDSLNLKFEINKSNIMVVTRRRCSTYEQMIYNIIIILSLIIPTLSLSVLLNIWVLLLTIN